MPHDLPETFTRPGEDWVRIPTLYLDDESAPADLRAEATDKGEIGLFARIGYESSGASRRYLTGYLDPISAAQLGRQLIDSARQSLERIR